MEIENLKQALAVIDNSIKKIDSARVQVEKVTESGSTLTIETRKLVSDVKNLADVIKTETSSVISLFSETLNNLDSRIIGITGASQIEIHKGIDNFKLSVENIESVINKSITDIKTLSIETIQKQESTNSNTINSILESLKIETFSTINQFQLEVNRLDEKSQDIESKITRFNNEIVRLEGIDLAEQYNKHHQTLADVLNSINSISLTLSNITQGVGNIAQSINYIETSITTNFKETNQQISTTNKKLSDELAEQKEILNNNIKLFDDKTNILKDKNDLITKEIKTNRIIFIVGFIILMITLIL